MSDSETAGSRYFQDFVAQADAVLARARDAVNKRHHITHRNGTDLQGDTVAVTDDEVHRLYSELTRFLQEIDRRYLLSKGK
jgi:hypothetical protein